MTEVEEDQIDVLLIELKILVTENQVDLVEDVERGKRQLIIYYKKKEAVSQQKLRRFFILFYFSIYMFDYFRVLKKDVLFINIKQSFSLDYEQKRVNRTLILLFVFHYV